MSGTRRLRAFKRWMASQGIQCSEALQLTCTPDHGFSVRALCPLSHGDLVATIPKLSCLTIRTSAASQLIQSASLGGALGLGVALMYERSLGDLSAWASYLHLFPPQECLPLVWSPDEVDRFLCGTELHRVTLFLVAHCRSLCSDSFVY